MPKDIDTLAKDIASVKRQVQEIDNKIDLVLEILNNFTLMILDEDEAQDFLDSEYDDDNEWIPEQSESWNSYDEEDELDG